MKQGKSRFDFQLKKIETLVNQAVAQENPALWLFANDMRTPMFMLEALSKMYANWHNEKAFTKLNEIFKLMEDTLGGIDYYAAFEKEFATNAQIPDSVKVFLTENKEKQIQILNTILKEKGWLDGSRLSKINSKLTELNWLEEAKETALLKAFYKEEIGKIEKFVAKTGFVFDDIEVQVHELRRKLRWLSIYPQALQGAIKLQKADPLSMHLEKYLTPEIVNSPFNKFPISETQTHFLVLEQSHFLALSWMIKELGKIKDNGLRITAIKEALMEKTALKTKAALAETYKILGADFPTIEKLLGDASRIAKLYFAEKNLKCLQF